MGFEDDDDLDANPVENLVPAEVIDLLRQAERFELFSIDPNPGPQREPGDPNDEVDDLNLDGDENLGGSPEEFTLSHWPILGSVVIDPGAGRAIAETLVRACEGWDGSVNECWFEPRHALRAMAEGRSVDLLICFACDELVTNWGKGHQLHYLMGGHLELKQRMNDLLCRAGVPLAEDFVRPEQARSCSYCDGSGDCYCKRKGVASPDPCARCNGSGKCQVCKGTGRLER